MKFKDIKEFSDKLDYQHMLAPENTEWCINYGEEIYWADSTGDGYDVYSANMVEGSSTKEDYFITNGDTQQGYWQTFVFPLNKKLSSDEFEDKYWKFM